MRAALALGGGVVALTVLTACTSPSVEGAGGAKPTSMATTTTPARGDIPSLNWALPSGEPPSLDYAQAGDFSSDLMVSNLCDSLVHLNDDFTISPNIATSWRYADDRKTLIYTLRDDVRFWDGSRLTADDVAYSMKRNLDPDVGSYNASYYANVKNVEASGAHQVTVRFKQPDELFNKEMATVAGSIAKASFVKKAGKGFGNAATGVMCSGPFELDSWSADSEIRLTRNTHYWNKKYRARAAKVTVSFVTDTTNLTQALKSGQLDGAYTIPASAVPALTTAPIGKLYQGPGLETYSLAPTASAGAKDEHLRRALSLAVDRKALATAVFHGTAEPAHTFVPKTAWAAEKGEAKTTYQKAWDALKKNNNADLAAARKELAASSRPKATVTLGITSGDDADLATATLVQEQAHRIGLKIVIKQLQPLQFSTAFYDPKARKGLDFLLTRGFLSAADPLDYLSIGPVEGGQFNWFGYKDALVDKNIAAARSTSDAAERARLIAEAQARYDTALFSIPLLTPHSTLFLNSRVTGATVSMAAMFTPSLALIGSSGKEG
ncbi:ABC transporter substrate-binding protein [Streptomyces sp. NPDC056390]|uniref:ABC transporter substrate-binding protein n=1 Tax=Streptomyces sp. NPDC056390 TaxID=3345806 RepID=UPI0035DEFC6F